MHTDIIHTLSEDYVKTEGHSVDIAREYALVERCKTGDIMAFRDLYEQYKQPLYTLARRFHGNEHDAQDSVQEAFIQMYRGIQRFRHESRLDTWMYRIVMNCCISKTRPRRHGEVRVDFSGEEAHPDAAAGEEDVLLRELLEREIGVLPEQQRAVFLLYAVHGQTHADIAEQLGISIGTSKSTYSRARQNLRERLSHHGIHDPEILT
jgi:RNA polymerase sigma-70 factor (ECF subfamily)